MCFLAQISRAGYYRALAETEPAREEIETRAAIQQVALEHKRRYGYRRVTFELRDRGFAVNHKRVARLMREDNLLAILLLEVRAHDRLTPQAEGIYQSCRAH